MIVEMFLKTAAAPAIAVAILIFLFGGAPEPWRARVQSLILALGFCAACYLLEGFPPWPPQGGAASLTFVALWFAFFNWVAPPGSLARYMLRGFWIVCGTAIACWSLAVQIINSPMQSRNVLALVCLSWGMWSSVERTSRQSGKAHAVTPVTVAMVSMTAASLLFVFKGSLLMSQMLTAMAVLTGALGALAWLVPSRLSVHAIYPLLAGMFGVFLICGFIFLEIDPWLLISMAIPFGVLLFKDLFRLQAASPFTDAFVTLMVSALPLSLILFHVFQTSGPLY